MNRERSAGLGAKIRVAALAALLGIRLLLLSTPGYQGDLQLYEKWSLFAGLHGIQTVYDAGPAAYFDYPPLYAYLLAPMGWIYARFAPDAAAHNDASRALGALVKLPPLAFDLLIAGLMVLVSRRLGLGPEKHRSYGWSMALLYLLEPAVLFDSGHWGQPDAVHGFFLLAALTLILLQRPKLGWSAAALGCLMKPLAWPFLPLLAFATIRRSGTRGLLRGAAAAGVTALLVLLPFIATGRGPIVFYRIFFDADAMPFTSANAHNLWWLFGPWRPANTPWMGPVTATEVGLALFGAAYLFVLAGIRRVDRATANAPRLPGAELADADVWFLGAALVAFSFFFFSTHMHENHLFSAIPFLVVVSHCGKGWVLLALLVGTVSTINMVNHDFLLAPWLYPGDSGVQRILHDGTLLVPPAMNSVATANAIATAGLFLGVGWAFARLTTRVATSAEGRALKPSARSTTDRSPEGPSWRSW